MSTANATKPRHRRPKKQTAMRTKVTAEHVHAFAEPHRLDTKGYRLPKPLTQAGKDLALARAEEAAAQRAAAAVARLARTKSSHDRKIRVK